MYLKAEGTFYSRGAQTEIQWLGNRVRATNLLDCNVLLRCKMVLIFHVPSSVTVLGFLK